MIFVFVFGLFCSAEAFLATDSQKTDDVQYLHLLLADEKSERMRLQNQVDQMNSALQTLQEQMEMKRVVTVHRRHPMLLSEPS